MGVHDVLAGRRARGREVWGTPGRTARVVGDRGSRTRVCARGRGRDAAGYLQEGDEVLLDQVVAAGVHEQVDELGGIVVAAVKDPAGGTDTRGGHAGTHVCLHALRHTHIHTQQICQTHVGRDSLSPHGDELVHRDGARALSAGAVKEGALPVQRAATGLWTGGTGGTSLGEIPGGGHTSSSHCPGPRNTVSARPLVRPACFVRPACSCPHDVDSGSTSFALNPKTET